MKGKDSNGQTLAWDVPPPYVVISETCTAQADATGCPSGQSAAASNGLDARFCQNTSTTTPHYSGSVLTCSTSSARSTGTSLRLVAGADQITVECSPSTRASSSAGPYSFSVDYSVSVDSLSLAVLGSVQDSQGCFCEVSRAHAATLTTLAPVTISGHQWSVSGSIFKDYVHGNPAGYLVPMTAADLAGSLPEWRWISGGGQTVSCSADVSYAGISLGSVSVVRNVFVERPQFQFVASASGRSEKVYW